MYACVCKHQQSILFYCWVLFPYGVVVKIYLFFFAWNIDLERAAGVRNFFRVPRVDAGVEALGLTSAAFSSTLAGSWARGGAARTQIGTQVGCWHCRRIFAPQNWPQCSLFCFSFTHRCPIDPAPLIRRSFLSLVSSLGLFIKHQ